MGLESRSQEDDLFAFDKDDQPVILIETKAMKGASRLGVPQLLNHLHETDISFGIFADLDEIQIFRRESHDKSTLVLSLKTAGVLCHYEPEFLSKRIFATYFEGLVEAWLRDFAFHWKYEHPPGFQEMAALGLLERLAGGMTGTRRVFADPSLH